MPLMPLEPYRAVVRTAGVPRLFVVGFLARAPVIAMSVVLTLHVVLSLHLDYARAGLIATVLTVSAASAAPGADGRSTGWGCGARCCLRSSSAAASG